MARYDQQRTPKTPPHVSLRALRIATSQTLEQVAASVTEHLTAEGHRRANEPAITRGAISAIESGIRGASREMLAALAVAYGLEPGDIVTDYEPRKAPEAVTA